MTTPITVNQPCVICSTSAPSNPLETACHHIFCRDCFIVSQASQADDSCTLCGRATQISLHSLLDADINTMRMQHTDLQTSINALYAQSASAAIMLDNNLSAPSRPEENRLEQQKRTLDMIQVTLSLGITNIQLAHLENAHRQVGSDIEALQTLQRTSQDLSTFRPAGQVVSSLIMNPGKTISKEQKRIQDTTMTLEKAFRDNIETMK